MSSVETARSASSILCVDDDPVCLMISQKILRKEGWEVVQARNVPEARALIDAQGCERFACVLTDYSMPGETGLDLVAWLRARDESLSVILVTGKGDREMVRQSLREGVFDFLDKPIPVEQLGDIVKRAAESTRHRRHVADRALAVEKFSSVHEHMLRLSKVFDHRRCRVVFRPLHEAGGDFISHFKLPDSRSLFLLADVSGHDLKDAYLSAVFQGYLKGLMRESMEPVALFGALHNFLVDEWNGGRGKGGKNRENSSLALCAAWFDEAQRVLTVRNSGQPPPRLTFPDWTEPVGTGAPPLGWFDEPESDELAYKLNAIAVMHSWTDGFEEFAAHKGVDPFAVVYRVLNPLPTEGVEKILASADDDILLLEVDLSIEVTRDKFVPIIAAQGDGSESEQIDGLVEGWGRSLDFSGIALSEAARFDVLLCARELALNAMRHGCKGVAALSWGVQIHFNSERRRLRLSVRDPGPGYSDRYLVQPEACERDERHCGLILLKRLGENIQLERNGAWVSLELPADRPM